MRKQEAKKKSKKQETACKVKGMMDRSVQSLNELIERIYKNIFTVLKNLRKKSIRIFTALQI